MNCTSWLKFFAEKKIAKSFKFGESGLTIEKVFIYLVQFIYLLIYTFLP